VPRLTKHGKIFILARLQEGDLKGKPSQGNLKASPDPMAYGIPKRLGKTQMPKGKDFRHKDCFAELLHTFSPCLGPGLSHSLLPQFELTDTGSL
jgi:hypothetical protein